ncbi:hypothetical protein CEP51_013004 [Fusarium floridanum]|uniref:Uncharacterized protein n=1 Tax=Fusarium floridanum TaxID=1325733 RepID=A0A428QJ95_9HYPO|nr:hypothetical protein CEP51_013004 [Fusarium floridanum]
MTVFLAVPTLQVAFVSFKVEEKVGSSSTPTQTQEGSIDVGLIRTDASEENRFLVYRIRPLCHHALWD